MGETDFSNSTLREAQFSGAVFKDVTYFSNCHFPKYANFQGARFEQKCSFIGAKFDRTLNLLDLDFHQILICWEQIKGKTQHEKQKKYHAAAQEYLLLKTIMEKQNKYDDMDEAYFRYRQMENKKRENWYQSLLQWISYLCLELGCGYGTRPLRIMGSSLVVILFFGFLFGFFSSQFVYMGPEKITPTFGWSNALYFSTATFTTMGFGDWAPHPNSLMRFWITLEAFLGIFTMSLFTAVFTRKIIR